jgi:xylulokinase
MYLGIDLGTSEVKTVLVDADQRVLSTARAPLAVERPCPGFSEQDPERWWEAVVATVDGLHRERPDAVAAVRGIGLSGQMHGATLLDAADRPLRPCILWNDGRAARECAELDEAADFRGISGNLVMAGFTAPKLRWVERHEPEIFAATRRVLLPKDYVRLRLTGEAVSEMSDAAGTLWLDTARRAWSPALLAATHLDERHMPRLVEGTAPSGRLRAELATRWGMAAAPEVAGGGGDNAASACGVGAVRPATAFLSLGTSGVLFVATDRFRPNVARAVHAFCHALPDTWHQMAVILAAADSLAWWARQVGSTPEALTAELGERPAAPSSALFLPYLGGERTPHDDATIRGGFAGLGHEADRAALTRAVLEGVAFAFKDGLDALAAAGSEVAAVTAVGGGARSTFWLHVLASVLERPIRVPAAGDVGAAFGAARLAMAATGVAADDALFAPPPTATVIEPDAGLAAAYRERLAAFRALYPALKSALG